MAYGAIPPDIMSVRFWNGPGAGSFFASAANLEALAAQILSILGGHQATAGGLTTAWAAPTGWAAIAANEPYIAWLAQAAAQLTAAGVQITAAGEAFEAFRAATPTPLEVNTNQTEHVALNNANFLGFLTGLIIANRIDYSRMWVQGTTNMHGYAAASGASVGAIPPLPPPTPTAAPVTGDLSGAANLASEKPLEKALQGAEANPLTSIMPLLGQLTSAPGQLSGMGQGGGLFSGLTQLPQQALSPFMSMVSQFGNMSGADELSGDGASSAWINGTPAAGGPVSASLSGGGGGGGFAGGGAGTAMSPLRGPASWNTVNAAVPNAAETSSMSRIAEARTASTMPATAGGMGSPGAMMAPMAAANRGAEAEQSPQPQPVGPLAAAAELYRTPSGLPVVTGGDGTQFARGEEAE